MLRVWDRPDEPAPTTGQVYCWSGHAADGQTRSLLRYVDEHGSRLRQTYLEWIHDLGETRIEEQRVIDHLALKGGLSYWWMTLLVEQSPWKSPAIVDALRLLALEEMLREDQPASLVLVSSDPRLDEAIGDLCRRMGIAYSWQRAPVSAPPVSSAERWYRALPHSVQAVVSLARHLVRRWPLSRPARPRWFGGDAAWFFCSYFIHLDRGAGQAGRFVSRQWGGLPDLLRASGRATNWLQHFLISDVVPTVDMAMAWVARFNAHREREGAHAFVDSFLSWRIVWRAVRNWLRLARVATRLRSSIRQAFRPAGFQVSLWPVMRDDWHRSLRGSAAMENLLWVGLFDQAFREIPHQERGVYLNENQGWERAFVQAWRTHGHGRLIAVAHATVRFWDLRYFTDVRTLTSEGDHALPQPDVVVVNGRAAIEAYRSVSFPEERMVECEALRYGYLADLPRVTRPRGRVGGGRVLILGDFQPAATTQMLRMLEQALPQLPESMEFTMKPHPNFAVVADDFPSLRLSVVESPVQDILPEFDVAFCGASTSASVDAYLASVPVMVMLDDAMLNVSPARGLTGVRFVCSSADIAAAFCDLPAWSQQVAESAQATRPAYFCVDPALPKWRALIAWPLDVCDHSLLRGPHD